ncbi:MAG: alkaline phosphatase family protein [Thermoanaerobaculaceae bacterium]|nr:alkaline phosphatase family protein [Thermoanaerobaculaceae bacterium]
MGTTVRPRRVLVVALAVGALLAVTLGLGVFHVGPGEAVVVQRGGGVRLFLPGWHWRLPLGGATLRVPTEPVAAAQPVAVQTREGAVLRLQLEGRFALDPARAQQWFRVAGWRPFLDGVFALAQGSLATALQGGGGGALLGEAAAEQLARRVRDELEAAGARVEGLHVQVPQEENPVAAALARSEAVKLAQETTRRLLVVGWDAADWQLINPLLRAGRMPNLARLVAHGARGFLRPDPPLLSPLIWTTFATGKRVSEHGITDFLMVDAAGKRVPISSDYRKVHALWTALSALGKRTDVIGWWATWPAEPILGRMVTERVAYQLFGLEGGSSNDGKVHPPELWPRIEKMIVRADDITYQEARRFIDISQAEFNEAWDSLPPDRRQENRINHLRKVLAATRTYQAIALDFLADPADLSLFYFEGTDTIGHLFAQFLPPRMPKVSEEDVRRFGRAMPEYYVWMDELLGQLLAKLRPEDSVMILSDHGFYTGELRPDSDPFDWTTGAPQWHREVGMIVVSGGGVAKTDLGEVTMYDVTPTILALLGLPVPRDLPGKVLTAVLPQDLRDRPIARIASFEALPRVKPAAIQRSAAADRERMQELAALGYISPGVIEGERPGPGPKAPSPAETPPPATAPPSSSMQVTQLGNLAASLRKEGRLEEAKAKYLEAIELAPTYFAAYQGLAGIFSTQGNHEQAFHYLATGLTRSPQMPAAAFPAMVEQAAKCGRLEEAAEVLQRLERFRGGEAAYHAAWGRLHQGKHEAVRAIEAFRRALAIDPVEGGALQGLVEVLRQQGREEEAKDTLRAAFAAAGNSLDALNAVTAVALAAGWAELAEPLLAKVLANDPGNAGVLFNLGVCQAELGKNREAEASLRQCIARSPNDPSAYYNLGMVLGVQGRVDEAIQAFTKALQLGLNTAQLHIGLARAYFFKRDYAATVAALKRALAVEPTNQEATKLLELLRQHGLDPASPAP